MLKLEANIKMCLDPTADLTISEWADISRKS